MYDASSDNYPLLRLLGNTTAKGEKYCPDALAVSPDGRRVAFIGPSEYTVTVVDSKSLDEVTTDIPVRWFSKLQFDQFLACTQYSACFMLSAHLQIFLCWIHVLVGSLSMIVMCFASL